MTFPVDPDCIRHRNHPIFRALQAKLVVVHQKRQGCCALPDDFVITELVR